MIPFEVMRLTTFKTLFDPNLEIVAGRSRLSSSKLGTDYLDVRPAWDAGQLPPLPEAVIVQAPSWSCRRIFPVGGGSVNDAYPIHRDIRISGPPFCCLTVLQ